MVATGIVAGQLPLACQLQLRDHARRLAVCVSRKQASEICEFIELLPHVEGKWSTRTILLEPVQIFMLTVIFGWRRKADGGRRFQHGLHRGGAEVCQVDVERGGELYCLTCEREVGPQIVIGATTAEQASKVFLPAKRMVEQTADLRETFELEAWARAVSCKRNSGTLQAINAKGRTQDGWNPHGRSGRTPRILTRHLLTCAALAPKPVVMDHHDRRIQRPRVCYEQRSSAVKVLRGANHARSYVCNNFTIDEGDNCFDERVWIKANPMLGITPSLQSMRSYAADARVSP